VSTAVTGGVRRSPKRLVADPSRVVTMLFVPGRAGSVNAEGDHRLWPRTEAESRQHRQALRVHAQQDWLHDVDIIMHLD
jgi:hypothetical protein